MLTITLCIPTYEPDPSHLRSAIESVLVQGERDWELFIHDDASKADVMAMVEPYLRDKRICFIRSNKRLGIGGNWNACRTLGTAPLFQFLFQDDIFEPSYLQKMKAALDHEPRAGFAVANHRYVIEGPIDWERRNAYERLEKLRATEIAPGYQPKEAFLKVWIQRGLHPNIIGEPSFVMLRRSLLETVGTFREDMPQGLDVDYWLRCLLHTDWMFLPQILGDFRVHASAASAQNDAAGHGLFDRLRLFDLLLASLPSGDTKKLAERTLISQFAVMTEKFRSRMKDGKKVGAGGSGSLFSIAAKHPILVAKGVLQFLQNKNT